jgi:hypothetical protein
MKMCYKKTQRVAADWDRNEMFREENRGYRVNRDRETSSNDGTCHYKKSKTRPKCSETSLGGEMVGIEVQ